MPVMAYDPTSRLLLTPEDPDAPVRAQRLAELGLGPEPMPQFDEAARQLAGVVRTPFAMVTLVDEAGQYFAGLHVQPGVEHDRSMPRAHGFCPHVVVRRRALVLDDIRDYPRYAANPVVDEGGIRSYLGAPLLHPSGIALGTICAMDRVPRSWGRAGLDTVKAVAARLTRRLLAAGRGGDPL